MYMLASQLRNLPIISLQTGQAIGQIKKPLIGMSRLNVVALSCQVSTKPKLQNVILLRDIRQLATDCIIIDSDEDIEEAGEIVRLQESLNQNFNPIGKHVVNEDGNRLGKVEDYTINMHSALVQKLYVNQPLWRSVLFNDLVIDRSQIIDINTRQFTVKDASIKQLLPKGKAVVEGSK